VTSVIKGVVRGGALVTALAVLIGPAAWADGLTDPPQARVQPPGGFTANARVQPPVGSDVRLQPPGGVTSQHRIQPPGGNPSDDVRIQPPGGVTADVRILPPVGITQLFLDWLRARIGVPIG
jgi:hypothetical protein